MTLLTPILLEHSPQLIEILGLRFVPTLAAQSLSFELTRGFFLQARQTIVAHSPENAKSLEKIESAIIIVALDDTKPVTREEMSWALWVGDGKNRFFDKHECKLLALPNRNLS